ncbi:MAG: ACT domain-containing protein [Acidimicrobiia bacterium]
MTKFAVWTLGVDRPGIVASVTGALFEEGCNLADCSMTILAGNFAMVLIVDAPAGAGDADLAQVLAVPAAAFDLGVAVRAIGTEAVVPEGEPFVVSVYGADRPGIVHHVAAALADLNVNIRDLETRVIGDAPPVYAMLLEVSVPEGVSPDEVAARLRELADTLGVDATLHPSDADVL